ncbi:tail fiber protein [Candidatus Symbiopectobacterium sp. NZEC127]|nr:tail fiber protein [Candidatus Symbiopectobacterium sp. NZEC127]
MLNGAWGLGGAGRTIALGDADFITWLRSVGNGSQTFRNTNANSYTKQYGSTILAKAGDTWGTVSVGYTSSANINNNGVRIAGGTVDGLHNNIYELWTDKNLPNPATLDTDQTITGKKIFNRDNEAIQLKPLTDTQSCFIRGQKSGDTPHWYIGKAGGDYAVAWANQHATSLNSITLREDGNTHITVASGKNVNVVIGGAAGRVLSQGHNAESDANGIWKVPGSAGLTPAAIGALAVSDLAGIPLPFPGSVAPSGWLKCNGQSFNTTQYPVLASRYPSGVLPDLRAEFIRGADDGRGVDTGRALLSAQGDAIRNITGKFANNGLAFAEGTATSVGEGAFTRLENNLPSNGGFGTVGCHYTFDASKVVPTASENRPRNIAFNYIVRAA